MGLASSTPALYQAPEQSGNNVYTDKGYVDRTFVTNANFNTFHQSDYRPFKADYASNVSDANVAGSWANFKTGFPTNQSTQLKDYLLKNTYDTFQTSDYAPFKADYASKVTNATTPGSLAYALQGITDNKYKQLQNYVTADSFPDRFDNRFESDTAFSTKFNNKFDNRFVNDTTFNTKFNTKFNTQLSAQGYNTLGAGWKINQDTITREGSAPVTRICYLNGTQREMCVDQNGKVYLQGLGINNADTTGNSDLDVYSSLLAQQTNYWNNRPQLTYAGGWVYNTTSGLIPTSGTTPTSTAQTSTAPATITTSSAVITTPNFTWSTAPTVTQTSVVPGIPTRYNYDVSGNVNYNVIPVTFLGTFQNIPSTINIIYNNASITSSTTIPLSEGTLSNITFTISNRTTTGFTITFNARYNGTTSSTTQLTSSLPSPSSSFNFTYSAT
jgi:hypothetical protein